MRLRSVAPALVSLAAFCAGADAAVGPGDQPAGTTPLPVVFRASELPGSTGTMPANEDIRRPGTAEVTAERVDGALRLTYRGQSPAFVPLCEVVSPQVGPVFRCEASVRGGELSAPAYLEMWFVQGEEAYFSRALNEKLTGPTKWHGSAAPFYADRAPDSVVMGVRFEGAGSVDVREISLRDGAPWQYAWVPGTLIGVLGGVWGALGGSLARRGRGRALVMILGLAIVCCSTALLLYGLYALLQGAPYAAWYPSLLAGAVGTIVFGSLLPVVRARYAAEERARMAALEQAEAIR